MSSLRFLTSSSPMYASHMIHFLVSSVSKVHKRKHFVHVLLNLTSFNFPYACKICPCCHMSWRQMPYFMVRLYYNLAITLLMVLCGLFPLWDSYEQCLRNILVQTSWCICAEVFLGYKPGVEFPGHREYKYSTSLMMPSYFSKSLYQCALLPAAFESCYSVLLTFLNSHLSGKYSHVPHQTRILSSDQQTSNQVRIIGHLRTELLMH